MHRRQLHIRDDSVRIPGLSGNSSTAESTDRRHLARTPYGLYSVGCEAKMAVPWSIQCSDIQTDAYDRNDKGSLYPVAQVGVLE